MSQPVLETNDESFRLQVKEISDNDKQLKDANAKFNAINRVKSSALLSDGSSAKMNST